MTDMPTVTTKDGVEIFYKDWGSGQPIVFSHGWPLSANDWDAQMLFFLGKFLGKGFRVVAHAAMAAPASPAAAMTWIIMPTTSRQ
jgi:pimeloyl-ACP methyl ester carboxylesterase